MPKSAAFCDSDTAVIALITSADQRQHSTVPAGGWGKGVVAEEERGDTSGSDVYVGSWSERSVVEFVQGKMTSKERRAGG